MNKVFAEHLGDFMEIYINDMLVKTTSKENLISNLRKVFSCLLQHNMRLNPQKCVFAIEGGKFLSFMLIHKGIEANPAKCRAIIKMKSPNSVTKV